MVVVNRKVEIISVLFLRLVVFLFVGRFLDYGRFVVESEVEAERVSHVGGNPTVAVVEARGHSEFVLLVVDEL